LALSSCFSRYVAGYTIAYYDFHNIDKFTINTISKACGYKTMMTQDQPKAYTILRSRSVQTTEGLSYRVVMKRFTAYCDAYKHSKDIKPPRVKISQVFSTTAYRDMIRTETFVTSTGLRRQVKMGTENVIYFEELGAIKIGGYVVSYYRQSKRIDKFLISDVLEIAQYKVIMREERFIVDDDRVETAAEHLRPALSCHINSHGFQTHDRTFIYNLA
jgi:hypothetical protein